MERLKNEQGYALVTVLLIIVIFTVLFLSFAGQSFSSVKQNQVSEKSSQSVALAEMGINYYKAFIQKTYEDKKIDVSNTVQQTLNQNNTTDDIRALAASAMSSDIQQQISSTKPVHQPIDDNPNATYTLTSFTPVVNLNKITITYSVFGTVGSADTGKTLTAVITIDLSKIVPKILPSQKFNKIPILNQQNATCTDISNSQCTNILVAGMDFSTNINHLDNKTIYSTDYLKIDGNANNSNVNIHSDGPLTIGGNMNHLTDSIVETNDSATFNKNLTIDSSKPLIPSYLLVNKDLSVSNHLTLNNVTYSYIEGNANIGDLDISSFSKMCVQGNLTVNNDITKKVDQSNLLVYGNVTSNNTSISTYTVSAGKFISNCGSIIPLQLIFDWGGSNNVIVTSVIYK